MRFPLKVTLIYALVSIAWISTSDHAVRSLFDASAFASIQTYKSWLFVAFTSLMLYLFLAQETRRREHNEAKLAAQQDSIEKLTQAVDQSPASVIVLDTEGRIEYVNKPFEEMSGYSCDEVLHQGLDPKLFNSGKTPQHIYNELWDNLNNGQEWKGELINKHRNGSSYWVRARITPVREDNGLVSHILAVEEDITAEKSQESRISERVNYDNLTELPNKLIAMDRMGQSINHAIRHDQSVVMMYVDIDDLSRINHTLGYDCGDDLITIAAGRIAETVRQTDTVARHSDDEFLVILNQIDTPTDAPWIAEKILSALAKPFNLDGQTVNITGSIGISVFPDDGQDPNELLRHANAAMFAAKDQGGNSYEFYSAQVNEDAHQRMDLEHKLRQALENNELTLSYQPLISLEQGNITEVEALLRWHNPELGQVPTRDFLAIAEASGLILPIGKWVIQQACRQLQQWRQQGLDDMRLMINLSAKQFHDSGLLSTLHENLQACGLNGDSLVLEINERLLSRNQPEVLDILNRIRQLGIRIALDDFGSGQSSLNLIRSFPLDILKIDRETIAALPRKSDKALVQGTLALAREMGLRTVGEGVETTDQRDFLKQQGVDDIQGHLYSPALSPDQVKEYVDNFSATHH